MKTKEQTGIKYGKRLVKKLGINDYLAVKSFYVSLYGSGTFYPMLKRRLTKDNYEEKASFFIRELLYHSKECAQYQYSI